MARPRKHNKHLPPNVYQRHGGYHYVKGGKSRLLGHDLPSALRALAAIVDRDRVGTLDAHITRALAVITRGRATGKPLAASTARQYEQAAKELRHYLRRIHAPVDIQPRDVVAIKRALVETPNYANRVVTLLRQICEVWLEEDLIDSNPAAGVRRYEEAKRERLITMSEFVAIRAKAGPRLQVLMDLWFLTGQRVTDVMRIRMSDLTDEGIAFKQQKTGARLIVQWSDDLRAAVERAKTLHGNVRALTLLHNRRGKAPDYSTVKEQWDKARTAAGVPDAQLRDLRAMSGTEAEEQELNPTALLGHTSPTMTKRYLRAKKVPLVVGPAFKRKTG